MYRYFPLYDESLYIITSSFPHTRTRIINLSQQLFLSKNKVYDVKITSVRGSNYSTPIIEQIDTFSCKYEADWQSYWLQANWVPWGGQPNFIIRIKCQIKSYICLNWVPGWRPECLNWVPAHNWFESLKKNFLFN